MIMSINVELALPKASAIATKPRFTGVAFGLPRLLLRVEGALVLLTSTALFATSGSGWLLYAVLFFTPDIFMLGYLRNPRLGAVLYNFGHSYLAPACLYAVSFLTGFTLPGSIALIWIAHIGFDRMVGYGLKYSDGFKHTHLG